MTRITAIAVIVLSTACDPTGTGPTGGTTPDSVVYNIAPCGSIAVTDTAVSTELDAPAVFEVGQLVGGRIDPEATTNFRHFWDIDLAPGVYHLVADNTVPDGSSTNTGIQIKQLDAAGVEVDTLIRGNEIDHRVRSHTVVSVNSRTTLRLEIESVFGLEDYLIGVFENETPVPSPYFEMCPTTTPIELGVPLEVALGEEALEDADEAWLTFDAGAADYSFLVDSEQVSGASTNLIYSMSVVDRFGQVSRYEDIIFANEIDVTSRHTGALSVGEPAGYWIRVINGHDALDLTITLDED